MWQWGFWVFVSTSGAGNSLVGPSLLSFRDGFRIPFNISPGFLADIVKPSFWQVWAGIKATRSILTSQRLDQFSVYNLSPSKKTDWREFYGICMVTLIDSFSNFNLLDCISLWWVRFGLVSIWTKGTCWCRSSLHALFSHHVPQKSQLSCLVLPHHTIRNFPSQSTERHTIMANHSNKNFTVRSTRLPEIFVGFKNYPSE